MLSFSFSCWRWLPRSHESLRCAAEASEFCRNRPGRWNGDDRGTYEYADGIRSHRMTGHGAKFGRKKEAAIVALLTHRTTEDAARAVGIGGATLLRWQKEPEFQAGYREAKRAAYAQSIARLHQMSSAAVSTLGKVMVD